MLCLTGCRQDMNDQHRYEPLEASDFFEDGRSARPLVEGTVARGQLRTNDHLYTGKVAGKFATNFPFHVTRETLERGRERYDIFCAVCHDRVGNGQGMVVRRGFRQPRPFHIERLRQSPDGYFYDVISNGFGTMASYADCISPEDRWAIVAYIRALQLSQRASLDDVPEADRRKLSLSEP